MSGRSKRNNTGRKRTTTTDESLPAPDYIEIKMKTKTDSPLGSKRARMDKGMEQLQPQPTFATNSEAVFSNFIILKQIFSNLSAGDLKSCCEVNPTWRSVADPLMCHYRIVEVTHRYYGYGVRSEVFLSKTLGCAGVTECDMIKPAVRHETRFDKILEELRSAKQPVSIELTLNHHSLRFPADEHQKAFLTEFGDKVHILDVRCYRDVDFDTFIALLPQFVNLEVLKCKGRFYAHKFRRPKGSTSFTKKKTKRNDFGGLRILPYVSKIYMGDICDREDPGRWKKVLHMVRNGQEFHDVPVQLAVEFDQIIGPNAFSKIKSLTFPENKHGTYWEKLMEKFPEFLEKLADENVKLEYCSQFPCLKKVPKELHEGAKNNFLRILKSSSFIRFSLQDESKEYLNTSYRMSAVKILQFVDESTKQRYGFRDKLQWTEQESEHRRVSQEELGEHSFFSDWKGTQCTKMFPKLEGLEINFGILLNRLQKLFPMEVFGPKMLGKTVKKLRIYATTPEAFQHLIKLFPHVEHLEMVSTVPHFRTVFPLIATNWQGMRSMSVRIKGNYGLPARTRGVRNFSWDSVLTGLPENILTELARGNKSSKKCEEKVLKFQATNPSLIKMKELQRLEFTFAGSCGNSNCSAGHPPAIMTEVVINYALKNLPDLEVIARAKTGQMRHEFDCLKDTFSPLVEAGYLTVDNNYDSSEYPFM